jgi:hypothetical protein
MAGSAHINASSVASAVKSAAHYIRNEIFSGRIVRVGFSEKRFNPNFGPRLETAYATVTNEANHVHNYPLSIAGWALVEGRIISWPQERLVECNFDLAGRLGKLEELDRLVADDRLINAPPYLARAVDVGSLKRAFAERQLKLSAFYQDWSGWSPAGRYSQFISVPVPLLNDVLELSVIEEFGVFNIDSFESAPLLDESTETPLLHASEAVADAYRRFAARSRPNDGIPT